MLIKILILPYIRCGSFFEGCITKFSRLTTKSNASPFIRYMIIRYSKEEVLLNSIVPINEKRPGRNLI